MSIEDFKSGRAVGLTEDLTISLIRNEDLKDIVATLENPSVAEYLFFAPSPVEVYQAFFQPIITDTEEAISQQRWPENPTATIRDRNGRYMGMCGLSQVAMLGGNFDVGFQLPEHAWRQGIATAACHFMTDLAFEVLGAHKLCADCYASNVGSAGALLNCGFVQEGQQKDYYKRGDGFDDRLLFGLTKAGYLSR